jgi:CHASE2 domain-containing protein
VSETNAPSPSAANSLGSEPRRPSPLTRTLVRLTALVLIGALLFVFHGIRTYLTPWSQAIINGIVKYAYPSDRQAETTVVLFREDNLRSLKEAYPVSYQRHAEVLDALSVYQPRAVFIDFVFLDKRPGMNELRQAICDLRDAGTAVYLAVLEPMQRPPDAREPWLFDCAVQVSAQMAPIYGASGVLTYAHGLSVQDTFLPTPAFAIASSRLKLDPRAAQDMEIIWGNGVADLNRKWMSECTRSGNSLAHLVSIFTDNPLKSAKLRCPYTQTLTVAHLLGSSGDADVGRALKGSAVFYGAAFNLTGDRVASPVFEELPGVYLHAMAYDNLLTLGGDYKRAEREFFLPSLTGRHIVIPLTGLVDALLLLATVGILLLVEEPPLLVQKLRNRFTKTRAAIKWLVLGLIALLVVMAIATKASLWSALGLLLLMIAITILDLAPPAKEAASTLQGFVVRRLAALIVPILAVVAFILVDRGLGLEAALLTVAVPGYFLYKVVVGRDMLFAATAVLLVLAALVIVSPPVNLGPRNVIAYVAFFEVARSLLKHADAVAAQYFRFRAAHRDSDWGRAERFLPALDQVFGVCERAVVEVEASPVSKEETHAKPAGAPA